MTTSVYDLFVYLLEPVDLNGQSHSVTVETVTVEQVYNPRAHKPEPALVVTFKNARKHMKLNKTQAKAMMQITGTDDYSKWPGIGVILTPAESPNGRLTIAITSAAKETRVPLEPENDDPDLGGMT